MRYILFLLLFLPFFGMSQSETNDMITYDTTYRFNTNQATPTFTLRITRPRNMFTPNHPDTASRPVIITMPGAGEVGTNPDYLDNYGPHYWLYRRQDGVIDSTLGWNGGLVLGNGTHFPIYITVITTASNVRPQYMLQLMTHIRNTYHIKRNSVHVGGLSMGGWTWGRLITYSAVAGDETAMSMITSFVALEGIAADNFNGVSWGDNGIGHWGRKYGGAYMGFEGTNDQTRKTWIFANQIDDSTLTYGLPPKAYYTYVTYNNGSHCCWNSEYDPYNHDWKSVPTITNPNLYYSTVIDKENRMGSYRKGQNLFEWMLAQGDTTLVSGIPGAPIANAGADVTVNLPTTNVSLNGTGSSGATSYLWTVVTGPNTPTITNAGTPMATAGSLIEGEYIFNLHVTNVTGSSDDTKKVTVVMPGNIPPTVSAGANQTLNSPLDSTSATGTAADSDGTIVSYTWAQTGGEPCTITNGNTLTATFTNLNPGINNFLFSATDNNGATSSATMSVTIVDQTQIPAKSANIDLGGLVTTKLPSWSSYDTRNGAVPNFNSPTPIKYTDGTVSGMNFNITNSEKISDNGATVHYTMAPDTVCRYTTYSTVNRVLTITGVNQSVNLIFYCNRSNTTVTSQTIIVGGQSKDIQTNLNTANAVTFLSVQPSPEGVIVINFNVKQGGIYLDGWRIEEIGAANSNQPPIVNAGSPQTISTSPGSAVMNPTITDELIDSLTYIWAQIGGPSTVAFSNYLSKTPTVTGMTVAGNYNLRLTATDNQGLAGSGNVIITANTAGNTLPVVGAGGDQTITLPLDSVTLTGTATDADGTIASRLWTKKSGPVGSGTIVSATSASTKIRGLTSGAYVFTFTGIDNSGGQSSDDVNVIVNQAVPSGTKFTPSAGSGEYQSPFVDSLGDPWAVGNLTNIGTGNTGVNGVVQRVLGSAIGKKMKGCAGGLHHLCFWDVDGFVHVAGDNTGFEHGLGNNTATYNCTQIMVDSAGNTFNNIVQVTAAFLTGKGCSFFAIKDSAGTSSLWAWGILTGGMRGNGSDSAAVDTARRPIQIILPDNEQPMELQTGTMAMLLCKSGNVYTWGATNPPNLGYAATGRDYQTPHKIAASGIKHISGAGLFNHLLAADGKLYGFGSYGNYMGNENGLPITTPTLLTNIMNALPAGRIITDVFCNSVCTHLLLDDSSAWGYGNNAQGTIGNGIQLAHPNPYAWDFGRNGLIQLLPVAVMPGMKIVGMSEGNTYTFCRYAWDKNGKFIGWGKNKANVLPFRIISATSQLTAQRGNSWDVPWPKTVQEFGSYSTSFVSTSPICITDYSTSPCNGYTIPANTAPVANAGSDQSISVGSTTLNASGSTDNVWIQFYEWTQVSGPSQGRIYMAGDAVTVVDNLSTGTSVFKVKCTDNGWLVSEDFVSITVGAGVIKKQLKPRGFIPKRH